MIRNFKMLGLLGLACLSSAALAASASAPVPSRSDGPDDAKMFCTFTSNVKGASACRAYAKFNVEITAPADESNLSVDPDDKLKVICGDLDNDANDTIVYNDGLKIFSSPADDTTFKGIGPSAPRIIVEDIDLSNPRGVYRSSLKFRTLTEQGELRGSCEVRWHRPGLDSGTN